MKMTKAEVAKCVIDSLHEVLDASQAGPIEGSTDPIQHLGLDSFDGVAYACAVSDRLGFDVPDKVNPFVDDDKHRSRCVSEIVDLLYRLLQERQEKDNAAPK